MGLTRVSESYSHGVCRRLNFYVCGCLCQGFSTLVLRVSPTPAQVAQAPITPPRATLRACHPRSRGTLARRRRRRLRRRRRRRTRRRLRRSLPALMWRLLRCGCAASHGRACPLAPCCRVGGAARARPGCSVSWKGRQKCPRSRAACVVMSRGCEHGAHCLSFAYASLQATAHADCGRGSSFSEDHNQKAC